MTDLPPSTDALKARGLMRIAILFACLSALLFASVMITEMDKPRPFAVQDVSVDDFANKTSQALLNGTLQVRATRMILPEATETSIRLTGGSGLTVLTPYTEADWVSGDPVQVVIVSPTITGVTQSTMQAATQNYINELTRAPDDFLVTLLPEELSDELIAQQSGRHGISEQTLFVWADHINAISFAPKEDPLGYIPPFVTFLIALGFFVASRVFKGRAQRV